MIPRANWSFGRMRSHVNGSSSMKHASKAFCVALSDRRYFLSVPSKSKLDPASVEERLDKWLCALERTEKREAVDFRVDAVYTWSSVIPPADSQERNSST